jgi:hypothetical protein
MDKQFRDKRSAKTKRIVLARDGRICQACGTTGDEVHHIQPLCFGGEDSPLNAVVLCNECHREAPDDWRDFLAFQREGLRLQKWIGPMYRKAKAEHPAPHAPSLDELVYECREASWGICQGYHGLWRLFEDGTISAKDAAFSYRHMLAEQHAALNWLTNLVDENDSRVLRAEAIVSIIDDYLAELENRIAAECTKASRQEAVQ